MNEAQNLGTSTEQPRVRRIAGEPRPATSTTQAVQATIPGRASCAPQATTHQQSTWEELALRFRLQSAKDELELFGWDSSDLRRIVRQAKPALPLRDIVAALEELVAEERAWYAQHAPLADDQLDHTLLC